MPWADTEDGDALSAIEQPYGRLDVGASSRRSHRCDRILMSTQDLVDGALSLGINFSEGARHIVSRRGTLAQGRRDCCLKLAKPFEAQRLHRLITVASDVPMAAPISTADFVGISGRFLSI